jgi:hypothetical protein
MQAIQIMCLLDVLVIPLRRVSCGELMNGISSKAQQLIINFGSHMFNFAFEKDMVT